MLASAAQEFSPLPTDLVNHPPHYQGRGVECIAAIRSSLDHAGYCGYLKGNAIKYLWRYETKGGLESLEKARWYINALLAELEQEHPT
jgi:hypothetical protein